MDEGELIRPSAWGYVEFRQMSFQGPTESGRDPLSVHLEDECRTVSPPEFIRLFSMMRNRLTKDSRQYS